MRYYPILLLILLPVLSPAQTNKKFIDTAGYFTAQYPDNWINKIKTNNRVFFTSPADSDSDSFYENINISVTPNEEGEESPDVKKMFPEVIDVLKEKISGFTEESRRIFKWNTAEAAEIIYTGYTGDPSIKIRCTQWYCYYKSRMYIATFIAEAGNSKHNETAKQIMNSIIFK